jgi:hypothetical protein
LTEDLAGRLDEVSPPYENWAQVARLSRLAQVIVRPPRGGLPADVGLGDQVQVAEQLARAERDSPDSPALRRLLFAFATYERDLHLLGLDDAQLTAEYPRRRLRLLLAWSVLKVLLAVPVASLGFVVHVIPFQLVKQLAKRPTNEGVKATVKLLGCFATFVLAYAALGYIIGTDFGAWPGLLVAVASPLSGYVAVRLNERVRRIGGVVEGYRTVKGRRAVLATVFAHRQDVVDAAGALVAAQ